MFAAKVLLVDDDARVRALVQQCLASAGEFDVLPAGSVQACQVLDASVDAILLNASLPGLDMSSFVVQIRQAKPGIVVMVLGQPEVMIPGVDAVFAMPIDPEQVTDQVRDALEKAKIRAQVGNLEKLGGPEFVLEMINLFLQHSEEKVIQGRAALAAGDHAAVSQQAHALKSNAANMGAASLRDLAEHIELHSKHSMQADLPELWRRLETRYYPVKACLEEIKAAREPSGPG